MTAMPLIARAIDGSHFMRFPSITEAEKQGYSADCIGHCLRGRTKSHAGYSWEAEGVAKPEPKPTRSMITVANFRNFGYSNKEIAEHMGISHQTVRVYAGRCIALGMIKSQAKKGSWNEA